MNVVDIHTADEFTLDYLGRPRLMGPEIPTARTQATTPRTLARARQQAR